MFPVTLKGDRINLREFEAADSEARWSYVSDPLVSRYQSWTPLADLEACKDMLLSDIAEAKSEDRRVYLLAVELEGQVVGEAGIILGSPRSASGSIFFTVSRQLWRHGYATEAAQMVLQFTFRTLGLHRVEATVHPDNAASRAVVTRKLGMQYEGRMRKAMRLFNDEWSDSDLFSLLQREWQHPPS
ncbi:MAG: GNAT family protein [Candidatus Obscuribacterales bacterium]|nr:GNAT family protein [Candidatus Obscuribacterales bacterium]